MTDIEAEFTKKFNSSVKPESALAPIKEAEEKGVLEELMDKIDRVKGDEERQEIVEGGLYIYRISWNEELEKVQVSCYTYESGIVYEGDD